MLVNYIELKVTFEVNTISFPLLCLTIHPINVI